MVSYAKRVGRKVYKATGYKNPYKKGRLSSSRVVKQVPKLLRDMYKVKQSLNVEKKRLNITSVGETLTIAQVNSNQSGHYLFDMTPQPNNGTGYNERIGNQIKVVATHIDFQFTAQSNCTAGNKIKVQLVQVVGIPYSTISDVMGKFVIPTKFITTSGGGPASIYDAYSDRQKDYYKSFRVLRTKMFYMPKEDSNVQELPSKRCTFGCKFKGGLKVTTLKDQPDIAKGQVFLLITCSRGNSSLGSASSLINNVDSRIQSGINMAYEMTHYFVDN